MRGIGFVVPRPNPATGQWCDSSYKPYAVFGVAAEDPGASTAVEDEADRVLRGGAFNNRQSNVRSADRFSNVPSDLDVHTGFRVARTYP
jgi:formylglycine-generating enzyme required for sulfatase activity